MRGHTTLRTMSEEPNPNVDEQRRALAYAFDQSLDHLAEVEDVFVEAEIDPFAIFRSEVLDERELTETTYRHFEYVFDEWSEFMERQGRHPACPNAGHVEAFIHWQTAPEDEGGKGNANRTLKQKLRKLNQAYSFWQRDAVFPHTDGFNPIYIAWDRIPLPVTKEKEHRRIPVGELREMVDSIQNLRSLTIVTMQLKLGLRADEIANCKLCDLALSDSTATTHLPELGSHDRLESYDNAIYVPSKRDREGNKSSRPRILPLDEELRSLLDRYLLVRPDNGEPWLFLSQKSHSQLDSSGVNDVWKDAFHPEYAETEEYRPVTSHFGRHRFTTYWRVEQDVNRQLVKYMRGDRTGAYENAHGMNAYLHAYYEDIKSLYRDRVFTLFE